MIEGRKTRLRREISRRERELERLESLPDFDALAIGTVVALFISQGRSRILDVCIGYKTRYKNRGHRWFLTGHNPEGSSSDELADWLTSAGRRLENMTVLAEIGPVPGLMDLGSLLADEIFADSDVTAVDLGALLASVQEYPRRGSRSCMIPDCGCSGEEHP